MHQDVTAYVDRVADFHIRFLRPSVIDRLVPELLKAGVDARVALEAERHALLRKHDFAASVKVMAN